MSADWGSGIVQWIKAHGPAVKRTLSICFIALIVVLLGFAASRVQWQEVWGAMRKTSLSSLMLAAAFTVASYASYASFDLLGKWYTGHNLGRVRTFLIGCVSYAFIMTLGSSIGGLGLRLRLYTKSGLSAGQATRIFGLAVATNWSGYGLIAGGVFASGVVTLPSDWRFGTGALQLLGAVMVLLSLLYLAACFLSRKRTLSVRGHDIELPTGRMALAQMALAMLNWCLMGGVLYALLPKGLDYPIVLGVVLLSAIAGLIARVPAGLGVLEAMTVAILPSGDVSRSAVLAATLVYRAVYYLMPLFIAGIWYLLMEAHMKREDGGPSTASD